MIESAGRKLRYVTSGCVKSGEGDLAQRLKVILEGLNEIIAAHGPIEVAVEKVFVNVNPQSTLALGQARGTAICAAVLAGLPVAEVRHAFTKKGGNLGSDGSVAYLFKHCGQFMFAPGTSEERVMDVGLEAGADDVVKNDDGSVELICAPGDFSAVKAALEKAGLKPELAEITMKPSAEAELAASDAGRMRQLLDALESLDDVQDVYTTAVIA